ncbi:hypothetical protein ACFYZ5_35320 [Streptomyces chartreusis]|uniref:hypothetical protein n=1 Tax=Streptomyces chartreusis TaxID=1969 RepID=UPI0036A8359F
MTSGELGKGKGVGSFVRNLIGFGLAVLLIGGVVASVVVLRSDTGPRGGQRSYVEELDQARRQLFQGQVVYTDAATLSLEAGEPQWFEAEIRGSWRQVPSGDKAAGAPVGAQIGMTLHCSGAAVTCTRVSSERKSVLSASDKATWVWEVTAKRSGKVALALTMTAYFRDTDTVLFERSFTDHASVATASEDSESWLVAALVWVKGAVLELGLIAGALATIWGLYLAVKNRRHPAEQPEEEATPTGTTGRPPGSPPAEQRQRTPGAARAPTGHDDSTGGS